MVVAVRVVTWLTSMAAFRLIRPDPLWRLSVPARMLAPLFACVTSPVSVRRVSDPPPRLDATTANPPLSRKSTAAVAAVPVAAKLPTALPLLASVALPPPTLTFSWPPVVIAVPPPCVIAPPVMVVSATAPVPVVMVLAVKPPSSRRLTVPVPKVVAA